jgi:hypothetical protein
MLIGYLGWAAVLFAQNYSFTYVSRARNSGSLMRHLKAAVFSNGIWIFSQILMLGVMFDNLTGKHGFGPQVLSGIIYTMSTVAGSLFAHFVAQKTEKGKDRVGAHKDVAQFTTLEGVNLRELLRQADFSNKDFYRNLATSGVRKGDSNGLY